MGILDFITGEFIDVIHWTDDTNDTLVWRFQREGHEIKYGAKLTVREGQAAVLIHEGQLADVFSPGLYMLETNNMPILTTLQHWDHGFESPFKTEVYFINTTRFQNLKWGTKNPVIVRDPEFGPLRIRAYGTYEVKVSDPALFLSEIVGTDGEFTMDEISYAIRNIIVSRFSTAVAASGIPILDMAANTSDLGKLLATRIASEIAEFGLELPNLYIENISMPPAVEAALDKRTSIGLVGDLNSYTQYSAAEAMSDAAKNPNGGMGAGLGMGMGIAMANAGPWGARPTVAQSPAAQMPPPPPAVERVWHIAEAGKTTGPFSKANLGRMATDGSLKRDTYVWAVGLDGWKTAGEIIELAQLFTIAPPRPPKG